MATSTFERKIEVRDAESVKKLFCAMDIDKPVGTISARPYTKDERERGILLLRQCLSRSKT